MSELVIKKCGRLVWRNACARRTPHDQQISAGSSINKQGAISGVEWGSPAFNAKVGVGGMLVAVNGRTYKQDKLRDAIIANKSGKQPIELLIKTDDVYRTVVIDYRDGLRYPHLTRVEGAADRLMAILGEK